MPATDASLPTLEQGIGVLEHLASGKPLGPLMGQTVKSQEALYYVAHLLYTQARYVDSMRIFAHLLAIDHTDRRYHNGFAACHHMQRNYLQALKFYGIASALDLTDPEPVIHIAECHLALGNRAEARAAMEYGLAQARGNEIHHDFVDRFEAMLAFLDNVPAAESSSAPKENQK